jgi:hypothetical protein
MVSVIVIVCVAAAAGVAVGYFLTRRGARSGNEPRQGGRILVPCTGSVISYRTVDAVVRLAKSEGATIVPVLLERVPRELPLETALLPDSSRGIESVDAIQAKAAAAGVAVDPRVARGRSYRDALRRLLQEEWFERTIVLPSSSQDLGRSVEDVQFLLEQVPGEVMILRPDPEDRIGIKAGAPDWRERAQRVARRSSDIRSEHRARRVASSRSA